VADKPSEQGVAVFKHAVPRKFSAYLSLNNWNSVSLFEKSHNPYDERRSLSLSRKRGEPRAHTPRTQKIAHQFQTLEKSKSEERKKEREKILVATKKSALPSPFRIYPEISHTKFPQAFSLAATRDLA
jgi:hypothetical protein